MKYGAIITAAGAARLAAATTATGQKLNITHMAVGDGNGNLPEPSASQTALNNEVWRGTLNKITQNSKAPNQVIAELVIPPEVGGFWMRELGLYDDSGTLIAVANMAESYKPLLAEGSGRSMVCRMFIIISDMNAVNLSVDSSVIAATQEYVNEAISGLHRAIIDDVVLQHKVVHDIDYTGIFDGADKMSQGFCICDTPQGTRMFLHQPVSGGVRIVETTFNPDGENENPTVISFSPVFADIGHQSIGAVCEDGRVMLYTPTADGKGVNIINWNGADTSLTDVTRTEIFTSDFFTGDEIITVALSVDGSLLIVQSSNEAVHLHYNRDDRRTVYVFDRASLTFKHRIYLSTQSMVSQAFQGMASDGHYLFAYYGYTGVFLTHRIVVYNLSTGEVVRQFNVDGVRARYGRQKMLGNAELGYPVLQEAEGLALHNGKLYLLDMDFWCQTADVVSFEGAYFAARATNFSGRSPVNPSYWTPTAYGTAAATKYDATKSYTCGVATKRSKAVVSVEAYDGTGYLVDSGVAFPDSHASLFLSPNAVNIALSPNEDFQVAAYEQNLRSHRPLFEVRKEAPDTDTSAAVFRLYGDAFRTGEYTGRFVQWKHRLNAVHDCLEIRADVDLLSGGGINLYSMNDTQSAGRTRLYCTDGS
ncbi:TPA: phage tail protein, partial [Escherichia coli]|nr:phage tail protein [Escherichia coli]HCD5523106.1 phage tail protein [Escherichia coli]HCI8020986.1 phage tail protein [Escherichia coli]HCT6265310.1 phage tail protein [Escherichia coli]HCT9215550.1 phage tail protein [Escherichia coli]